ncbi:MAG TPA: hypothetical protein VN716_15240 [Vicinamibacterales bacterium]|nr:hypothetical protein [Vicinamibacterales bacterium]
MTLWLRGGWSARALTAVVVAVCGTVLVAQKSSPKDQKPDAAAAAQAQAQQQEIQSLVRAADAAMAGQGSAPADFPIQFQSDFLKAQGSRVWVPITLTIDPAKVPSGALTLYLRVVPRGMTAPPPPTADPAAAPAGGKDKDKDKKDKDKKNDKSAAAAPPAPNYPFEDAAVLDVKPSAPGQPLRILRGIGVPSGSYDVYVVLHERAADPSQGRGVVPPANSSTGKTSVLKQPLDVPNYGSGEFSTSTVILAERVDELPAPIRPDQQSEHPYAFGPKEIVVAPDHKFKKSQELIVLFQIYNPTVSPEKKFNLEATYTFYTQGEGGEKRFNATEPQTFSADSMGGGFDPTGNSSIQAGQGVPLQSFPEGTYRLEIKITDKLSNKVLTQNVNFTVTP